MRMSPAVIPFSKFSACGNDFVVLDGSYAPAHVAGLSRRLCERHDGVGADGVEWLFPAADADIEARLVNADGSAAEISGNGTRCVAAALCWERARERVTVKTGAGVKTCVLTGRTGTGFEFETAMGQAEVKGEIKLVLGSGEVSGTIVSTGNPHFVVFVDEFPGNWRELGAQIG